VPDFLVFAALVPKLRGAKVFLDIHDMLPEFYAGEFQLAQHSFSFKLLLLCERVSAAFADHVIIPNEIWRGRLLSRSTRSGKCTTILNYPDPEIFYPRPMLSRKKAFVIMYPGTLNRHQGVDIALRAFSRVADLLPHAEFHIYGEGPEKPSLLALRESLGLTSRVQINALLPSNDIAPLMAAADLAVVPKRTTSTFGNEAASGTIMELMSAGVPVIVSRTRIDTSYFDDSMVKFFEPENERELADAILELATSPKLRQELVMNATRYIEQNDWQQRKADYLNLVDCSVTSVVKVSQSRVHA
jgi:glycosyltransferase involved in cell wall biosynthesis